MTLDPETCCKSGAHMRQTRLGVLLLIVFPSQLLAMPAEIIIIRHAEKPVQGNQLSLQGRERAAALAQYFLGDLDVLEFGPPVAIYAQSQKHGSSSVRAIQTVKPLADALHLRINDSFNRDDYRRMIDRKSVV